MKAMHRRRLLLFIVLNRLILALHVIMNKVLIIVLHSSTSDILEKAERYAGENVYIFIIADKCGVFKCFFLRAVFYGVTIDVRLQKVF